MDTIDVKCSICEKTRTISKKSAVRQFNKNGNNNCRGCGRLTPLPLEINGTKVLQDLGSIDLGGYTKRMALFECKFCSKPFEARVGDITSGKQEGCTCRSGFKSNGKVDNPQLYTVWESIRSRCNCSTNKSYHNYGGRGISICKEWDDFNVFRDWAHAEGYCPGIGLSIDREDNNKDYCPENCRWVNSNVQAANKRYGLKETKTNAIGVFPNGNKFYYSIAYLGETFYKGGFTTIEEAVEARKKFIELKGFPHTLKREKDAVMANTALEERTIMKPLVIWTDTPVRITHKTKHIKHIKENRLKGFFRTGFIKDYGDIPLGYFNEITKQFEPCVNTRGFGYAKRKDIAYRKRKG